MTRPLVPAALLALALAAGGWRSSQELIMPDFPEGIIPA